MKGSKMTFGKYVKCFVSSIYAVTLWLVVCQPAAAQTAGEAITTMGVQQELMGSQMQQRIKEPNLNTDEKTTPENTTPYQKRQERTVEKAPVVIKTSPQAFANDVNSTLEKITVTFDQQMMDKVMSWTGGGETYPKTTRQPSYDQSRTTCTFPVSLEAGKVYWVGVNSASYRNFKNANGVPAKPYVILFATMGNDGKPTPIPEDLLQKAKAVNQDSGTLVAEKSLESDGELKDTTDPNINDFNDFRHEISIIDIEARDEESKWLGRLEKKSDLAKAMNDVVVAELKFLRKLAEAEGAQKTVEAIDLLLKKRQDRLAKLTTKLEDEAKTERRERRVPRLGGAGAGAGEQGQVSRPQRRTREPLQPAQPANTNTNAEGQQP